MYPRKRANETESIYEINSRPKFQYFSNMPAVLNVFIKMYNNVIFSMVLVQIEVDSCHMEIFNLFVEVPYSQGARWRVVLACAIGTTGLLYTWTSGSSKTTASSPKTRGSPQSSVAWEIQLSTCPVTSVFYRNFIKECLILLSFLMFSVK